MENEQTSEKAQLLKCAHTDISVNFQEVSKWWLNLITKQMNKHWHGIMYRTTEKCKYLNMSCEKKYGSEENLKFKNRGVEWEG